MPSFVLRTQKSFLPPIISFLILMTTKLLSQEDIVNSEQLSVTQGLSQSVVSCVIQDRRGFMWFGTQDGLNKYDGYDFTVYKHDPQDSVSLSNNFINTIYEDSKGILWIGTEGGGLNRFDPETERFTCYRHDPDVPNSLSHDRVRVIYEDIAGVLWIGTVGGGLNKLIPVEIEEALVAFVHYKHDPYNPNSLSNNRVWNILEDDNGDLWIGTNAGLNKLNTKTGSFSHYKYNPNNPNSLSNDIVWSSYMDKGGTLWLGTYNGGLNKLVPSDTESSPPTFVHYKHDPNNPNSLIHNIVSAISEDRTGRLWLGTGDGLNSFVPTTETFARHKHTQDNQYSLSTNPIILSMHVSKIGVLWVGTFGGGIIKFDFNKLKFKHYMHNPDSPNSLSHNNVFAIEEDQVGGIWIGTENGLNQFNREIETFIRCQPNPNPPKSLSYNRVTAIHEDRQRQIWVGMAFGGLSKLVLRSELIGIESGRETDTFINFRYDPDNPYSLSHNNIISIYEDDESVLWIGTNGRGLNKLVLNKAKGTDTESETFIRYQAAPNNPESVSNNTVMAIYEDHTGMLWIGTRDGLNKFNRKTQTFSDYHHDSNNPNSLSNNIIYSIYEDQSGSLWVGTAGGLNKFDRTAQTFTHFTEKNGLPNDVIYAILADHHGKLWLSTNKGLSRFDPYTETFRNYDVQDGLQSNEFNLGASLRSKSGELYFGGVNGFNRFHPDSVKDNEHIPPIVITDFKLFNESVPVGSDGQSPLQKHISAVDELKLSYRDYVFSFEFVALDYTIPGKNQYAYMLEGFDESWIYTGTRRFARYTNIEPGAYVFRVKGANNDGVWNEKGTSVRIIIQPPFWKTLWFHGFIIGSLLLVAFGIHKYRMSVKFQKIKVIEETKKRVADEFHDELGNSLTKIALYGEVLKKKLNLTEPEILGIVHRIIDVSNMTYDNMKDFIWSLKTDDESMLELIANIVRFGNEFYEDTTIKFVDRSSHHDTLKKTIIDAETKRHVLLILKEAMNNILKHAQCTEVTFEAKPLAENISFTLSDNGVGFLSKENKNGNGIASMHQRSESIGASFELKSVIGGGTILNLGIPNIS